MRLASLPLPSSAFVETVHFCGQSVDGNSFAQVMNSVAGVNFVPEQPLEMTNSEPLEAETAVEEAVDVLTYIETAGNSDGDQKYTIDGIAPVESPHFEVENEPDVVLGGDSPEPAEEVGVASEICVGELTSGPGLGLHASLYDGREPEEMRAIPDFSSRENTVKIADFHENGAATRIIKTLSNKSTEGSSYVPIVCLVSTKTAEYHPDELQFGANISDIKVTQSHVPAPEPKGRAIAKPTVNNVITQISEAIRQTSNNSVELHLKPSELGSVRIHMLNSDGSLVVNILAERAETADMVRRHVDVLLQEFRQIGYGGQSSFHFGKDGKQSEQTERRYEDRNASPTLFEKQPNAPLQMVTPWGLNIVL